MEIKLKYTYTQLHNSQLNTLWQHHPLPHHPLIQ